MKENFLLTSQLSKKLYEEVAKNLPIIDFHNHLSVEDITSNKEIENVAKLWVISDPYKHRALRILGFNEDLITGNADDFSKFQVWYNSLPSLVGNALYDWAIMELKTVFDYDYDKTVSARDCYNELNKKLKGKTVKDILSNFNIEYSAPCADIASDLSPFDKSIGLCPSLRGDNLLLPNGELIKKLQKLTNVKINSIDSYLNAVDIRLKEFKEKGLVFTDHALDNGFTYIKDDNKNPARFKKLIKGKALSESDTVKLSSFILKSLATLYAKNNFTLQLHIGAQRRTSDRLLKLAGPAGGYAGVGETANLLSITNLLNDIENSSYGLPKILLFTLNPSDNAVMATLSGSYSKSGTPRLISQGPAWWWCDHYKGITEMLENFMSHSVLSTFIGMTTDSRSPLSFVRHDYFRRVVCNFIANKVLEDRIPNDKELLSNLIAKICYQNAKGEIL